MPKHNGQVGFEPNILSPLQSFSTQGVICIWMVYEFRVLRNRRLIDGKIKECTIYDNSQNGSCYEGCLMEFASLLGQLSADEKGAKPWTPKLSEVRLLA